MLSRDFTIDDLTQKLGLQFIEAQALFPVPQAEPQRNHPDYALRLCVRFAES